MKTLRWTALSCAAVLLPISKQSAPPEQPFLLTRLGLELSVDYGKGALQGEATLTLRNTSGHPVRSVSLLLGRLMEADRVMGPGRIRLPFTQQVERFSDDPSYQVNHLTVRPIRPVAPGDSSTLTIGYHGILVGYTETGSLYIKDHVTPEFTIIREDALAFPVAGVPVDSVNRRGPRGEFAFGASITAPSNQVVAMGGEQVASERRDSLTTWRYRSIDPVPFLNITIAPYRVMEVTGARIFHFAEDSTGGGQVARAITGAIERFTQWFGPLPRTRTLTVMEIPAGYGSQGSLAAGIIQTADAFQSRSALRQLYHELSHLWNAPDQEHPSPRWNEGLASFLEYRMAAELDGWNEWDRLVDPRMARLQRQCAPPAGCDRVPLARYGEAGMTDFSYGVGFALFYALDRVLGPEAFNRTYRGYFQAHLSGGSTQELAAAFRSSGPAAERVLQDWLFTPRWSARLSSGETLGNMIEGYRKP